MGADSAEARRAARRRASGADPAAADVQPLSPRSLAAGREDQASGGGTSGVRAARSLTQC